MPARPGGHARLSSARTEKVATSTPDLTARPVDERFTPPPWALSITGTLFLLAGTLYDPDRTDDMGAFGGLAARTPRFADLFAVAAFASLGLPSFSGFIAEFQIVSARSPRLRSRPRSPSSAS